MNILGCFGLLKNAVGRERCVERFSLVIPRSDGSLRSAAMVVVGGKGVRDEDGLKTRLEGDYEVFLAVGIYAVAGR